MRRLSPPDPYVEAKLLGILLAGVLRQTRKECQADGRALLEERPSGVHRIPPRDPEAES